MSSEYINIVDDINYPHLNGKIELGLCCINTQLRKHKIFCSRTCIRKNFTVEKAKELALQNVRDISKLIEWNEANNIKCLRLSSDMFPHFTDPETEPYTLDFAKAELKKAGKLANKYGHRIVMHPSQFCQVGTPTKSVFDKTIQDLKMHADILDYMSIDSEGVIIVHGGGVFGDKDKTINRWIQQFKLLPQNVRNRLVVEHCEYCYSPDDVLKISQGCKDQNGQVLPVVFDTHHYSCYQQLHPKEQITTINELLHQIVKTWGKRTPLFHISQQGSGRIGHHSDYITEIPKYLLDFLSEYKSDNKHFKINLEVEAKMKELAIMKLYKIYPQIFEF